MRFVNVIEILEFVEVNLICSLTTKQGKNGSLFGQNGGKKRGFLFWQRNVDLPRFEGSDSKEVRRKNALACIGVEYGCQRMNIVCRQIS
jgi:hypothetical protein